MLVPSAFCLLISVLLCCQILSNLFWEPSAAFYIRRILFINTLCCLTNVLWRAAKFTAFIPICYRCFKEETLSDCNSDQPVLKPFINNVMILKKANQNETSTCNPKVLIKFTASQKHLKDSENAGHIQQWEAYLNPIYFNGENSHTHKTAISCTVTESSKFHWIPLDLGLRKCSRNWTVNFSRSNQFCWHTDRSITPKYTPNYTMVDWHQI